jgi:hypothetical protein
METVPCINRVKNAFAEKLLAKMFGSMVFYQIKVHTELSRSFNNFQIGNIKLN